ncbi:deoxyribodipyrimidine photo-lyase [Kangiella sp. HZ709]|uniref:cryptochrome/photolyase family protein n=1 Tax=Kangiella sp. HZ709 TaxID=2666328 RepID=UPI0012AFBA9E|nr:FAD-binding domain-containing protein [Kangiella sp. HZ709]MRX27793.1 deoxyribodipyrimidine photolyase [Kangiella sp. HZ709]
MSKSNLQLVWFRQDLRVANNHALYFAAQQGPVIGLYLEAKEQHRKHHESSAKVGLRKSILKELRIELNKLSIPLLYIELDDFRGSLEAIEIIMEQYQVNDLWFNYEYLLNEINRDEIVVAGIQKSGRSVHQYHSDLILEPNQLTSLKGEPYKVFTPYKRAWLKHFHDSPPVTLPKLKKQALELNLYPQENIELQEKYRRDLWPCDYSSQNKRVKKFLKKQARYPEARDIPSINGTSGLSPYLSLGSLSAQGLVLELLAHMDKEGLRDWQSNVWLSELIWRDFYRQIMIDNVERLCKHGAFKKRSEPWLENEEGVKRFQAWQQAKTGFPIVDAAMRQLEQTGWMHNRLRMIASMFLTKLCLVDWRWGEKHFMQQLIDGDFASNNGGWQWCASTGSDAVPYFRIMNPITQSKKFDQEGAFIKKFIPELSELDNKDIHFPTSEQRKACGYPEPVIDYKSARKIALELLA